MEGAFLRTSAFLVLLAAPGCITANSPQATVENTGSTNRAGLRVTVDREGHATVEPRGRAPEAGRGESHRVHLPEELCRRFLRDLETAAPVNELPAAQCLKSVSFGSRTFVEFDGGRSPDLSCPADDPRTQALQKDTNDILEAARQAADIHTDRVFTTPAPASR